jgi:putative ABC transport system permease protein
VTFVGLILRNWATRKLRFVFAALAVGVGVVTVVTFSVVNHSLRSSALGLLQTGRADFTIAQKGVSDILNSNVDEADLARIKTVPHVEGVTGVLIGTTRVDAANPQFLVIGVQPDQLEEFGVAVVAGRAFGADARDEVILGWRAARNLDKQVGDTIDLGRPYRIVGLYSTGQALGDAGAMMPLSTYQVEQRQVGELTLLFVRVAAGTDIPALQRQIDHDNPQLVTVRTAAEFGRADRSLALISAADKGSTVLAVAIGAVVVMTTMMMTFIERTREFGVLAAIGWPRSRILALILGEALALGVLGAAFGVALSFGAILVVQQLPSLVGILHPEYTSAAFWRAVYTAGAMSLLGGAYPAIRAAVLSPMEALRHE